MVLRTDNKSLNEIFDTYFQNQNDLWNKLHLFIGYSNDLRCYSWFVTDQKIYWTTHTVINEKTMVDGSEWYSEWIDGPPIVTYMEGLAVVRDKEDCLYVCREDKLIRDQKLIDLYMAKYADQND